MKIDHIGWITNDVGEFERFWVDILGFEKVWESRLTPELAHTLFGVNYGATCLRYKHGDDMIEVHKFDIPVDVFNTSFIKHGINHIALLVDDRKDFLKKHDFTTHVYHNPKGWDNIFIQDYEGNWIELKEVFK